MTDMTKQLPEPVLTPTGVNQAGVFAYEAPAEPAPTGYLWRQQRWGDGRMKLGQEVKAAAYLVRKTIIKPDKLWGGVRKEWRRVVYPGPRAGVLVGLRTLSDGYRVSLGEEGVAFKADTYHKVALISFDLRRAPRFVLLADIGASSGGES